MTQRFEREDRSTHLGAKLVIIFYSNESNIDDIQYVDDILLINEPSLFGI